MLAIFSHRLFLNSLSIALMAMLSYQLASVIWRNVDMSAQATVSMPLKVQHNNSKQTQLSHAQLVRSILKNKPFGEIQVQTVDAVKEETISAPETKLNYKLRGVYFSENESLSSAIIEIKNNNVESYAIKDEIENGITIHAIELKRIVLDRYGKYETLSLEEIKFDKASKALSVVSNSTSNPSQNLVLKRYRKRFVNNPMALARKFRSTPVTENGKTIGFKLKAVGGETLLKQLNISERAIFTSINGVGLDKPFQALDALKSLQTAKSVSVTYLLDGVEQARDFNL